MPELGPFQSGKLWLRELLGFEKDTLHVLIGLLVFVLVILFFRRKPWQALPIICVALAAMAGEAWDLYELVRVRGKAWAEIPWGYLLHDLWVTTIIPAGIFLMAYALRPVSVKRAMDEGRADMDHPPGS
ncbi:hypothetical protein [Sphingorhabdus sp. Alg239-R122]|uniref:hypothetical protein n=1 Tax=Sphingorhabdus sp. Alg239-R122 TaxID=2305989 RepID=UPI0013DB5FA1|nr:hypothetical protein [Sphingorhabdus sp. Alg239-R122]